MIWFVDWNAVRMRKRTLDFSLLVDARPRIETMPLERAAEAYARLKRGDGKFRMVLAITSQRHQLT